MAFQVWGGQIIERALPGLAFVALALDGLLR